MNLQIIYLLIICGVNVFDAQKCQLPSERSRSALEPQFQKNVKSADHGFPTDRYEQGVETFKRIRRMASLTQQIQQTETIVKNYCRPAPKSSFEGFKINNFEKSSLCSGEWTTRQVPDFYLDEKEWPCWTLPNFLKYECPTYNCLYGRCADQLLSDIESKSSPRVVYQCQIGNFVDIPFYVFCYNPKNSEFAFKQEVMTVSRCCECTKFKCTEN